jgi:phage RecT family recombinase
MANELDVRRVTMDALESYRASFGVAAQDTTEWDAFRWRIAELVATTPAFRDADTASKLQICRRIAATNLWPGLGTDGEAYVVKYGQGAAYVIGPRGWVSLLYRAGAKRVTVACVHKGDTFEPGSIIPPVAPKLIPSGDPGRSAQAFTHAIAFVEWSDGSTDFEVVDSAEIDRVKKSSPAGDKGPWGKWPEKMAHKVALRVLARNVSRRVEMPVNAKDAIAHAVEADRDAAELTPDDDPSGVSAQAETPTVPDIPAKTTKTRKPRTEKPVAAPEPTPDATGEQSPDATLDDLVAKALASRGSDAEAKREWETVYEGVTLHPVSIRRAIGGPFTDEADALDALARFIG